MCDFELFFNFSIRLVLEIFLTRQREGGGVGGINILAAGRRYMSEICGGAITESESDGG